MTEKMVDKIVRVSKNPFQIRNICTCAHIDHGKCVSAETRVQLSDWSVIKAEELFKLAVKQGVKIYEDETKIIYNIKELNIQTISYNKQKGVLEEKRIEYAWKLKGGKTIKVKLKNGFRIETTPEHKYLIFENSEIKEKPASELKIGDKLICANNVQPGTLKFNNYKISKNNVIDKVVSSGNLLMKQLINLEQISFIDIVSLSESYQEFVYDFSVQDNKNFLAEGVIIHNTTFSDNLLFGAGMMSEHLTGQARVLDIHDDEKARGITIDSVAVSMVHEFEGKEYLINLIDTPGHVDFGGDVTRAMRAIDGAIVLVCAVEGVMPQTETVLRQALKERVKPVLFINKVDRLIRELQLTPEAMQERFLKTIKEVNRLIREIAPKEYSEKWQVNVQDGSVAFGSAFHKWALSLPYMQKKNISFKEIIDAYKSGGEKYKELAKKAPLHEVILDMSIKHHPSPNEAQKYRIPKLWKGDLESQQGKDLINCDPKGKLMICITKVVVDPQAGEISCGRIFSGTATKGTEVYLNQLKKPSRIQQVFMFNGAKRDIVEEVPAGNVLGIAGIKAYPGETISSEPTEPFEQITHIFEPVITKAIEAKKPSDLPKLVEVLKQVVKEDPTIKVEINEETGENLIHGMGELHLEVIENRIRVNKGLDVKTSPPIVVYREAITKESPQVEGKTPNKHNKLYFSVKPLDDCVYKKIKEGVIPEGRIKKKNLTIRDEFVDCGWDSRTALKVKDIYKGCLFIDGTRGIVQINEIMEMLLDIFEQVIDQGPIAREPCIKIQVTLHDAKLHEDAIHRGPAQMYPAIRQGIGGAIMQAGPLIFEPLQILLIEAPVEFMGEVSKLISNKRGQLIEMNQEGSMVVFKAKMPVAELIGWSSALRSATGGRGNSSLIDQLYEKLPNELQEKVIKQIRTRKGLHENQ